MPDNGGKRLQFACAVNSGSLQNLSRNALGKLLDQENAEGPADDWENDCGERVVELQGAHLTDQRDQDNLFGQCHGTDDQGEDEISAHETLFRQRIARKCGSDAGEKHGSHRHPDGVDHPADCCRNRCTGDAHDGIAVCRPILAEGNVDFKERCLELAHQLGPVVHGPFIGPPDRCGGVDFLHGLECAGDNPVKREGKENGNDENDNQLNCLGSFRFLS